MAGEGDASVRVKFKYGGKCKVAKLEGTIDSHISSMESLRKFIFKHFPEIQGMVECPPTTTGVIAPTHLLSISCKDMAGDYIILENDDDLDAMEILDYRNLDFCIDAIQMPLSPASATSDSDRWGKLSDRQLSVEAPVRKKMRQCQYFQSGFCMYGERCQFIHDPTKRVESLPSNSDRWGKLSDRRLSIEAPVGKKMQQCRYFQSGFCMHGDSCQYVHGPTKRAESPPSPIVVDRSTLRPYLQSKEERGEELQSRTVKDELESRLTDQCQRLSTVSPTTGKQHSQGEGFPKISSVPGGVPGQEERVQLEAKQKLLVNRIRIESSRICDYLAKNIETSE